MPLFGPPNIKKMEAKRDVKGLIKTLGYPDKRDVELPRRISFIRMDAKDALVRIGTPAIDLLIEAIKVDKNVRWTVSDNLGRCAAAEALGQIGDARAVEPLIATFEEKWRHYKPEIHGQYHGLEVMNDFVRGLKAGDEYLPTFAGRALVKIGTLAVKPLFAALKKESTDEVLDALAAFGSSIVEPAIAMLDNPRVRSDITRLLVRLGDVRAIKPLILNPSLETADALVKFGAPAVDPLIQALKHEDPYIRRYAAYALGNLGVTRAAEPLSAILNDNDEDVRKVAFEAHRRIIAAHAK
jgi:HEAT repeat protein